MNQSFFWKWVLFIGLVFVCLLGRGVQAQTSLPSIDLSKRYQQGEASLQGEWGLHWGGWIPAEEVEARHHEFSLVPLPNFLRDILDDDAKNDNGYVFGHGTYAIKLSGLDETFKKPAINMRNVTDAWEAWWVDESGEARHIGGSGKISRTPELQQIRYRPVVLTLPNNSNEGYLVIHVSAHVFHKSGVYGELVIKEYDETQKALFTDLATRVALISIALVVVLQNLVFYLQRPKERVLLLLSIFAFAVLLRAVFSADYLYYMISKPSYFEWITKPEYLLVIWPAVAGMHFFACVFPTKRSDMAVKVAYAVLLLITVVTVFLPIRQVAIYLPVYQLVLVVSGCYALWLVIRASIVRTPNSTAMLLSTLPLFAGLINDVAATYISDYNFFMAEYTLFLFLLVQTQLLASRFVTALDTSEHLTENLQQEVALKTQELSLRNRDLEEKAAHLEVQHDKIKELSETDHLTGLYNRQTFDSYSESAFLEAIQEDANLALVMMDLDSFKKINDQYGHLVGDECLKATAKYLNSSRLRKNDFVARYGGEEIVFVLRDANAEVAQRICQMLCDGLREVKVSGYESQIQLTASFGIAEIKFNRVKSLQDLLNAADKALYAAKSAGKDRVVLANPSM